MMTLEFRTRVRPQYYSRVAFISCEFVDPFEKKSASGLELHASFNILDNIFQPHSFEHSTLFQVGFFSLSLSLSPHICGYLSVAPQQCGQHVSGFPPHTTIICSQLKATPTDHTRPTQPVIVHSHRMDRKMDFPAPPISVSNSSAGWVL